MTDRLSFDLVPRRRPATASKPAEPHKLTALRLEGGPPPLAEKELVDAAGLTVGHRYDPPRIEQAADAVRAKLVQRGFRGAAVDAVSEPVAGHERSRFELVLRVVPGPHVAVAWRGDDPGERLRREAMEAWPAYASPEAAASAVARALRVCLQARGFYEARVEARTRTEADQAEVTFEVTRGPKGSRVAVAFEGNSVLGDARLAATLPKPGSRAFFEALDRSARLTAEARIAYASAGHLRARVGPPRTAFDAATGVLTVTIPVRERGASRVARVDLPREVADAGAAGPALRLRGGQPFDVEAYLADRDAIAAWYREEGWMEARVRGVLEPRGGDVDVSFAAEPGPRPRRGEVRIASRGRTRDAMVLRQVEVAPGAVIRPQELSQTRARLSEMDVFTSVDVRPVPVAGQPDVRDLVVSYVERPDVTLEYGLRYDVPQSNGSSDAASAPSQGRLQAAAGFELANPFGLGWRLKGYTLQTTNLHNYRLGVESSTFLGLRLRTQLLFFDETDNESLIAASFASKVRGFSLQQTRTLLRDTGSRRWHDRLRLQWGYTRKDIQYSEDVGSDVLVAGRRAYLSASLIGDWRDSLTDPRRGLFWTATAEMSRRYLGSDVDYVRLYGQLFTYVPLAKRLVWASGYRAGVVPGDDPFYLLENRFQSGGPTTVRGFRQNGLGPQFDESEGFGGQGVLVLNQELRFPLWKQLHGGVFWDAGNTWLLASEFSLRDLRHTVGGGLRLMLPFGPIRVEYGFILDRRKNSDGTYVEPLGRFVFGLGHAF
ncbi:MAG: BamA/TamA family outer membrane protein [Vicinamibacteria bacterium]